MRRPMIWLLAAAAASWPLAARAAAPQTVTLSVQNMTCAICPITVRKALEKVRGVSAVKVDPAKKTATVTFDPDQANADVLLKATADAGYPASVE